MAASTAFLKVSSACKYETEKIMLYMGVDPGTKGAIVVVDSEGSCVRSLRLGKASLKEIWEFIAETKEWGTAIRSSRGIVAIIEKVHAMPKQGVSSSFKFGMAYGQLRAFLTAAGIPWREVRPTDWQKGCGTLKKGREGSTERKRQLKEVAQQRFPNQKIVLENADAFLIADFARRTNWG